MHLDLKRLVSDVTERKQLLDEDLIKELCERCKEVLVEEGNVRHVAAPVTIVGDVHGQFYDVLELFRIGGAPPDTNYVFLGDYVDRGYYSVETITLLVLYKLLHPQRVTLVRGNHESRAVTQTYGFYAECVRKYGGAAVWQHFTDLFDYLVLAVVVENTVFCVHGGLSPVVHTIDQISVVDRFRELPHEGPIADLVWSDPMENYPTASAHSPGGSDPISAMERPEFGLSPRGAGYLFGKEAVRKFLEVNGLAHVTRAHQLCQEGYRIMYGNLLSTVWSAPNYCYRCGNLASVLEVGPDLGFHYNVFGPCPENEREAPVGVGSGGGRFGFRTTPSVDDDEALLPPATGLNGKIVPPLRRWDVFDDDDEVVGPRKSGKRAIENDDEYDGRAGKGGVVDEYFS
ncbi:Metallo-dependent phosphatase [Gonapodya prolifera JEL478]|uniref:Serine/threonine-protein phosphatase n=1 Tax=Gonapodya prolifera (strain JEL478) TaxID=1344416 RepID=A0A139A680_GONPJ|nr:Metallo-dependent phosphatase [Gonapodya prolifera JEL478]|eukprot:KXS12312.1 Metallo-dependent phosphatase [Gonapodya prolifera JEL478]